VACAAALAVSVLPTPAPAFGPALQTSVSDYAPAGPDGQLTFSRVRAAGASYVHAVLSWSGTAPANRPPGFDPANPDSPGYDWTEFDRQVRDAVANGLQPIADVFSAPQWAEGGPGSTAGGINSPDPVQLGLFARAAAQRYDGTHAGLPRVRYWAVWNEPNASIFLTPQFQGGKPVSIARYRDMVNDVAAAVHGVRRDNIVVGGELFPNATNHPSIQAVGPLAFMRGLFCLSGGRHPRRVCSLQVHADVWATHPYASGSPEDRPANPDSVWIGNLQSMSSLLSAAQRSHGLVSSHRVGFWVTEYGWNTNPPNPKGVPLGLDRRWMAEALYRMWKAGVSLASYFDLTDGATGSSIFQTGLYFNCPGGLGCAQPKPSLAAFRFPFVAYTAKGGALVWGRTPFGVRGRVMIQRSRGSAWLTLTRLRTDRNGIFTRTVHVPKGLSLRGASLRAVVVGRGGDSSPAFSLVRPPDLLAAPFG
jgi:hypothetical protein